MSKVRAYVAIKGKVQGVYFRVETREQAQATGVTGWVRNRSDGAVEAIFEGDRERVEEMINWCRQGPTGAIVSGMQINWEDYRGDFSGFRIAF